MLGGANASPAGEHLTIAKSDYDAFERLLGDIQAGYSTEDLSALRAKVTPEMLSYFSEQLAGNASRGLINRVTDVKLLQGDLAEAWREGNTDYSTVAMNFAIKDSMVERASGRTVEGGERSEVTELWTFMRARGGNWLLGHPADLKFSNPADVCFSQSRHSAPTVRIDAHASLISDTKVSERPPMSPLGHTRPGRAEFVQGSIAP